MSQLWRLCRELSQARRGAQKSGLSRPKQAQKRALAYHAKTWRSKMAKHSRWREMAHTADTSMLFSIGMDPVSAPCFVLDPLPQDVRGAGRRRPYVSSAHLPVRAAMACATSRVGESMWVGVACGGVRPRSRPPRRRRVRRFLGRHAAIFPALGGLAGPDDPAVHPRRWPVSHRSGLCCHRDLT